MSGSSETRLCVYDREKGNAESEDERVMAKTISAVFVFIVDIIFW